MHLDYTRIIHPYFKHVDINEQRTSLPLNINILQTRIVGFTTQNTSPQLVINNLKLNLLILLNGSSLLRIYII